MVLGTREFGNDVYLSAAIPADKRAATLNAAYLKYRAHRQVAAVFTKNELIAAAPPSGLVDEWTLLDRAKASFNPERSGDLIVLLKPYVSLYQEPKKVDSDYSASHGSPWGYDRRVPILFWWRGIAGFEQPTAVETVDIAPESIVNGEPDPVELLRRGDEAAVRDLIEAAQQTHQPA